MNNRDNILASIKQNQPEFAALPIIENYAQPFSNLVAKFSEVLTTIGGKVYEADSVADVLSVLQSQFGHEGRMISLLKDFEPYASFYNIHQTPHLLENVEVAIIPATMAVAENGSVWVTDALLPTRVLPFICQHLVVLVNKSELVPTMHDAYDVIGSSEYGFGTFIAGPSKTADIEQSLVLGAHGPKTMTVFLMA